MGGDAQETWRLGRVGVRRYNYSQGSALGLDHTLCQTGPLRSFHYASRLDRLYYVEPGIGVPMTLISGERLAEAVVGDRSGGGLSSLLPEFGD